MELSYSDYDKHVEHLLKEETIKEIATEVKTFGKFKKNSMGQWEPIKYEGYTLITPTFPDDQDNAGCYEVLNEAREVLLRDLGLPQIVTAPSSALHMTVARLISDNVFETRVKNSREQEFLLVLQQLFAQITSFGPLECKVKGLSIFPQGVITALVSPVTEAVYQRLQVFRNNIYQDKLLIDLGVERKRSFHGHITLFYIEEELSRHDKGMLAQAIININKRFFLTPLMFNITRAEVRKFNNFSGFYREDSWPAHVL
ncbi:MAG: hypothetical protein M0T74_07385 [Desulfitobacterium hafniense]|nr:hypothetical protein [Desulfitobacterium hafniense]